MARTVEDVALMLTAMAGYDPKDPASADVPVENYAAALGSSIRGLKVGVLRSWYESVTDAPVVTAVDAALGVLAELGADVVDVAIPSIELAACAQVISLSEAYSYHAADLADTPALYAPVLRNRLKSGGLFLAHEYVNAQRARQILKDEVAALLKDVDVLITPSNPKTAPTFEASYAEPLRRGPSFTAIFNMTGLPALSIPCGFDETGLPIGLQIAGRPFAEAVVLQVGHAYERAAGWYMRHPALP
jgi:aspartyl-tRNA(Asn)/glutamyl-tRNA(Gln) amidotransferase subunit A